MCEANEEVGSLTGDVMISRDYYILGVLIFLWLFLFKSPRLLEIPWYLQIKLYGLWDLHQNNLMSGSEWYRLDVTWSLLDDKYIKDYYTILSAFVYV